MLQKKDFIDSLGQARENWGDKNKSELMQLLGYDVALMQGFNQQNPHHCFDLFLHSLTTVDNINDRNSYLLLVSAFFHDIGKPKVAKKKNNRLVFYGHALKSAVIAKNILMGMDFTDEEIEQILFYVTHHDDFISYILPEESCGNINTHQIIINENSVKMYVRKLLKKYPDFFAKYNIKNIMNNLLELCMSDVKAQAKYVYRDGVVVDSIEHKLEKLQMILEIMKKIL